MGRFLGVVDENTKVLLLGLAGGSCRVVSLCIVLNVRVEEDGEEGFVEYALCDVVVELMH